MLVSFNLNIFFTKIVAGTRFPDPGFPKELFVRFGFFVLVVVLATDDWLVNRPGCSAPLPFFIDCSVFIRDLDFFVVLLLPFFTAAAE